MIIDKSVGISITIITIANIVAYILVKQFYPNFNLYNSFAMNGFITTIYLFCYFSYKIITMIWRLNK